MRAGLLTEPVTFKRATTAKMIMDRKLHIGKTIL